MTRTALYRHFDADGSLLWVGVTANPFLRLAGHMSTSDWRDSVARVEIERFDSRGAAEAAETQAILSERPRFNRQASRCAPRGRYRKQEEPATELARWMKANRITNTAMAERLGVTQSAVSYYARGARVPHRKVQQAIETATFGAVPASSWSASA